MVAGVLLARYVFARFELLFSQRTQELLTPSCLHAENQGVPRAIFRKLHAVCGCGNFCFHARLRASGNFWGHFLICGAEF